MALPEHTLALHTPSRIRQLLALGCVVVLTGIGAGLGGMLLAMLLHAVQHLAYGYGQDSLTSHETFLIGVSSASPERRVLVLAFCGLVAGLGWWAVYRFGRPLVSIKKAVSPAAPDMPAKTTLVHALLQIFTVALGSPLGREVAPREIGALVGAWLSRKAGLPADTHRLMIACGAGAGLAAVYNVPLGGTIFVLEVLLGTFSWPAAIMALATSAIGAGVAWIGLGAQAQYVVPALPLTPGLLAWALIAGPLFGLAAHGFVRLTGRARAAAARGWRLPVLSVINFTLIGCIAVYLPQVLGNGKGPAQLGFDSELGIGLAALLLVVKVLITSSSLRAGAEGGLLTPGLAIGALLAIILGGLWSLAWPGIPLGAFAIVGAAAFLAASMSMPITAIVLVAEFTRIDHDFLVPIILAVVGSVCMSRLCEMFSEPKR
ncbi:chloride channel protein [Pseudomonas gingeri]|uniref:Chloride channel protein n=1 Tax=Pseudomonas gingeri TaxID=117681 RepID=A0A7Y8CJZ3_9PSED|nr:chloride channel protein [Pseudomonas gingeri]NWA04176.1 chloride channel protein [Pseudomonas gingeri]NWA17522.1 chloride channel protein [Pseudomonas gingeri]NWA56483.1 chloride channel protein [Pseudomonas gingeri]NWA97793.1 chloride channel protein [Pseudomonas gingeri]NWB05366.1 chloride channel protein [Pseudomonas gingeri]